MYTKPGLELGAFAGFDFSSLLTKAQTAVQKIQATAQKVKASASQFLPPEAVQTIQTPTPAVPISAMQASASSFIPSGLPVIPLVLLAAGGAFIYLRRKKGRR